MTGWQIAAVVLGAAWSVVILAAVLFTVAVVVRDALTKPAAPVAAPDVSDLEWVRHCDEALAVARDASTADALALADLAIWQMELCVCDECQALYAAFVGGAS